MNKRTTTLLRQLLKEFICEANHNTAFSEKLDRALSHVGKDEYKLEPRNTLQLVSGIIIEEIDNNSSFCEKLATIINSKESVKKAKTQTERPINRRDPAILDPIALIVTDETALIDKLQSLTDKQLKDIIANYGMDPSKLAMKWKDRNRLIQTILDSARRRASKGDVFRT